ncbi:MAG: histidine kinase, partial [Myxococcota bacterium]
MTWPAHITRTDATLVALCAVTTVLEGLFRPLSWPVFTVVFTLACLAATPFRHRYPFPVLVGVFGSQFLVRIVSAELSAGWQAPWSMALIVTVPYALMRRGNRLESILGIGVLLLFPARIAGRGNLGAAFGATLVLLAPVLFGLMARLRDVEQAQLREQAVQSERDEMAREIHDTVGHRLAAIAVQVQAARLDEGGNETLEVIEEQSARALSELRSIVRGLRGARAESTPLGGIGNLEDLGRAGTLPVRVTVSGDSDSVDTTTGAAVYRIAQESVTNAFRHGRSVNEVEVEVRIQPSGVSLTVRDDGVQDQAKTHR